MFGKGLMIGWHLKLYNNLYVRDRSGNPFCRPPQKRLERIARPLPFRLGARLRLIFKINIINVNYLSK